MDLNEIDRMLFGEPTAPQVDQEQRRQPQALSGSLADIDAMLFSTVDSLPAPLDPASPVPQPPELKPRDWTDGEEKDFKEWYKGWAEEAQIDPNPDDPRHQYNYRAAYRAGAFPTPQSDGKLHWPSQFKMADHPNRFVEGMDTITGQPMTGEQKLQQLQYQKKVPESQMSWWRSIYNSFVGGGLDAAETYSRAGRVLGMDTNSTVETVEKIREGYKIPEDGFIGILSQGISSTINSVASGVPGGVIGAVGGPWGSVAGFALGAGTLFSLAEYDRFMEEAEKAGFKREDVMVEGVISAISEGGVEALQDLVLARVHGLLGSTTVKPWAKQTLKEALKRFFTNTGKALPIEAGGEIATDIIQREARQSAGLDVDEYGVKDALKTAAVTAVQTILMGAGAAGINHKMLNSAADKSQEEIIAGYGSVENFEKAIVAKYGTIDAYLAEVKKRATETPEQKKEREAKEEAEFVEKVLPKGEGVLETMGALPTGEGKEAAREPVEEETIPRIEFATVEEAQEAGSTATEEEVSEWQRRVDFLKTQGEWFTQTHKLDMTKQVMRETQLYNSAIKAFERPEEKVEAQLTEEKAPEKQAPINRIPAKALLEKATVEKIKDKWVLYTDGKDQGAFDTLTDVSNKMAELAGERKVIQTKHGPVVLKELTEEQIASYSAADKILTEFIQGKNASGQQLQGFALPLPVHTADELPAHVKQILGPSYRSAKAVFTYSAEARNKIPVVYMVLGNIKNEELVPAYVHELFGHYSLLRLNETIGGDKSYNQLLDDIYASKKDDELMQRVMATYKLDGSTPGGRRLAADEWFAHAAATRYSAGEVVEAGWWDRFMDSVRRFFRTFGISLKFTDKEFERIFAHGALKARTETARSLGKRVPGIASAKLGDLARGKTYAEGAQIAASGQNILIQPKEKPGRVLFVQISTGATATSAEPGIADSYSDKLYSARDGYLRPEDFWEIPAWIPTAAKSLKDSDALVVRDPAAAAEQIKAGGYDAVMFSAMEVNKHVIKEIAEKVGPGTRIIVGGYVDKAYFKDNPNVEFHDTMESAVTSLGEHVVPGVDNKHFRGTATIPRLCLSKGCLHKCAFCTVEKGITPTSKEGIDEQLENLKGLKFKLVYLDDKTFGQAETYKQLPEIFARIKKINPEFEGFVIQTTAPQFVKFDDAWLQSSGIKFVELGVESFNDSILAKINKPAREKNILAAVDKMRANKIAFIPNVMVGLTGKGWSETKETYQRTLDFLKANDDIISHVNVYNLALYEGTQLSKELEKREDIDIDENSVARSYHANPKLHESFYKAVLKFAERQLSKKPFEGHGGVEASLKKLTPEEQAQYKMFVEKKKGKVAVWVQPKGEEIIDEETQEKVKSVELTAEAMAALDKANVKYGPGPFHPNSNFLVSVTERGGLIYGKTRSGDVARTRVIDTLTGREKVTEYFRKIGGKEFKVLNVPILPKDKAERVKLIDKLVNQFKSEIEWYTNWNEFMHTLLDKDYTPETVDKMLKVQAVLSAGTSPQGAQTAFQKAMSRLEEFGSVQGGEGKGFTKNMAKKINMIWNGEDKDVVTLEDMQKFYGKKIGAMVFAALHPGIKEGAIVVDRHMTRMWGYNAMWGGSFRVSKPTQAELESDISAAAKRLDIPTAGIQAALWYAAGAGHWGSATHFEEAIRLHPAKSLSPGMMALLTLEPQAVVSFHDELHYTLRGAAPARKWTKEEKAKVDNLISRRDAFSEMGIQKLSPGEERELLDLMSIREGIKPKAWSQADVQKRIDASTPDNNFVPLAYWYGSGVRREAWYWGKEPHLTRIYDFDIYDAAEDKLGYVALAKQRAKNDSMVKDGKRNPDHVFMNALAGLIRDTGDFKGFSIDMNGNTWVLTFDETVVEEHPTTVTVELSDQVNSAVKLPSDLESMAKLSSDLISKLEDHVVKGLKDYPITVESSRPSLARFSESTANQLEYGLSLRIKGPITAIRAAFSHIIGLQKKQNMVLLFSGQGFDGSLVRFDLDVQDLSDIESALWKNGIHNFRVIRDKARWVFETYIHGDEAENQTKIDLILDLYKNSGKEGTLERTEVGSELLTLQPTDDTLHTDYRYHINNYFGKAKGAKIYDEATGQGDQWAAQSQLLFGTEAAKAGMSGETAGEKRGVRDLFREPEDEGTEAQLGFTEKDTITITNEYQRKVEVHVLVNPGLSRLRGLLNRSTYQSVRALVGPDGTAYFWDATEAIHADVAGFYYKKLRYTDMAYTTEISEYNARIEIPKIEEAIRKVTGVEFALGGVNAFGAPTTKLQQAISQGLAGSNATEVWRKTGWRVGPGGQWRFLIDDTGATLSDEFVQYGVDKMHRPASTPERIFTLDQVYKHPLLYKYYPQLKQVKVIVERDMYGGYYEPETKTIAIGTGQFTIQSLKDFAPMFSAMHEAQHAIQHLEGFPMGSSPKIEFKWLAAHDPNFRSYNHEKKWDLAFKRYYAIAGEIEAGLTKEMATLSPEDQRFFDPYHWAIEQHGPISTWLTRHAGTSFSIDIDEAPGLRLVEYHNGLQRGDAVAAQIRQALKDSGLSEYKDVMDRVEMILAPFILPEEANLGKASIEAHAEKQNRTAEELESKLASGKIGVRGLTDRRDPMHVIVKLSMMLNRLPETRLHTTLHEFWHVIEGLIIPEDVQKKLEKFEPNKEKRANMFADYVMGKAKEHPTWVQDIMHKLHMFFTYLQSRLLGIEFTNAEEIFEWQTHGYFKPGYQRRLELKHNKRGRATSAFVADLEDMESGPASVRSESDPEEFTLDDEKTAKKRIKDEVVDKWMAYDALELNLEQSAWTPEKGRADIADEDKTIQKAIELPELLEIYKALMGGKIPGVREKIFRDTVRGVFIPKKGLVRLKAANFNDPVLATRVLGHEIGHVVDWLPDFMTAGNILGKIASLKGFVRDFLPFKPGAQGELTWDEVERLRAEAVQLLGMKQELRTKWIDTSITQELGITSEDVLGIWNNIDANIRNTNPELYKYIAGLSSDAKKLIIKQALKGLLAPELEQFKKIVKTGPTLRKEVTEVIYKAPTKEEISNKLAELIMKEIRNRKLWVEQEVRDELLTLSMRWRPFDMKDASNSYIGYRHSAEELYADAISALITDPQFLRAQAPRFYEAFFNYIDSKKEFRDIYLEIQRQIAAGQVDADRTRRFFEMFDHGNDVFKEQYEKTGPSKRDQFARAFIDRFHFIVKDVRKIGPNKLAAVDNPEYKLEEMVYTGSEQEGFITDVYNNVIKILEKNNLKWDREFGLVVMLRRMAFDIKGQAMPGGFDSAKALEKIAAMRDHELSPEQWEALKLAVKNFRELHEKYFIDKAESAQVFDDAMIEMFRDRDTYATFDVMPFFEERYGRAVASRIFPKIGSLQDIPNPATSTVMKDMAFMKMVNKNIAVRAVVKFYQDYSHILGIDVEPAKKAFRNGRMEIQEPKDREKGLVTFLHKGKVYGYYLPKEIADAVNDHETNHLMTARIFRWLATPFRKIFTELNYGFWMFNAFFRDAQRLAMTLPGWRVDKFVKHWVGGLKPAFKSVFGIHDEVVHKMQQDHMLISVGDYRGLTDEEEQMERLLKLFQMKAPKEFHGKVMKPWGHLFNYISNRARLAEYYFSGVGRALERTTKVAAYTYLKEKFPDMPTEVVGHIVRTQGGSPDFLRAGKEQQLYNNILMFSNAIKEGYRGDWEAFKNNPGSFAAKKAVFAMIPKLLMYAGLIGLLGEPIKEIFEGVSEYDLTNYFIIPLGRTESGKLVYWRVPTDETSRFFGGVLWKMLRTPELGVGTQVTDLADYFAGQAPTVSPGISILIDVIEYASGKNPYDHFYGRHAMGDLEFQAGDNRARMQFLKYLLGEMGASIVYKFKNDKTEKIAQELESVMGFPVDSKVLDFILTVPDMPVMSNLLGRFLKVSDYGVREKILRKKDEIKRDNARTLLDAREGTYAIVDGKTPTNEQLVALMQKPDSFKRQLMIAMARKYGNVYYEEWLRAGTNKEKAAILRMLMEKNALKGQESTPFTAAPPPKKPAGVKTPQPELPPLNYKEQVEKLLK